MGENMSDKNPRGSFMAPKVMAVLSCAALMLAVAIPSLSASASPKPKLSTIKLMAISTVGSPAASYPEVFSSAEAAAAAINKAGGVNGHPLKIITCNDNFDPNTATQCARTAVHDRVTAVVGSVSTYISNILPVLLANKIPSIGSANASAAEVTDKNSFTITAGTGLYGNAGATELINHGKNKIAIVYIDIPIVAPLLASIEKTIPTLGNKTGTVVATIPVSPTATDMSTYTAALQASGASGALFVLSSGQVDELLQSDYEAGLSTATVTPALNTLAPADLASLGAAANGCYTTDTFYPSSDLSIPGIKKFNIDLDSFGSEDPRTDYALESWASVYAAAKVMAKAKVYTSGALLKALPKAGPISLGVLPPFNWGKPIKSLAPERIFSDDMVFSIVTNGKIVPQGGFTNVLGLK
jgi:ABC-type branched-subunit amino acid transport system substrate-binding protein